MNPEYDIPTLTSPPTSPPPSPVRFRWVTFLVLGAIGVFLIYLGLGQSRNNAPDTSNPPTTETSFTVGDASVNPGVSALNAGDSLKLDLSQLSSATIEVSLVGERQEAVRLVRTPLLTDSIGLSITIPDATKTGRYNLVIAGIEKGEQITVPLTVAGTAGAQNWWLVGIGGSLVAISFVLASRSLRRRSMDNRG